MADGLTLVLFSLLENPFTQMQLRKLEFPWDLNTEYYGYESRTYEDVEENPQYYFTISTYINAMFIC